MVVARDWGKGEMGSSYLMGAEFLFCKMKRVVEIDFTIMWRYLRLLNCTLKNGKFYVCVFYHNLKKRNRRGLSGYAKEYCGRYCILVRSRMNAQMEDKQLCFPGSLVVRAQDVIWVPSNRSTHVRLWFGTESSVEKGGVQSICFVDVDCSRGGKVLEPAAITAAY